MCTLTYRLTEAGYELFFNRDEQRSRTQAIPPRIDLALGAIYPVDPIGKGTWLAVHRTGLSLALLNYYQAEKEATERGFTSRGEIILTLLKSPNSVVESLKSMQLSMYQPFQLCIFPEKLTRSTSQVLYFQWDGEYLHEVQQSLPITSSSVDYLQVYQARRSQFELMTTTDGPTSQELLLFHNSQQKEGKLSVKMFREDAKTVSFSHICINAGIVFNYIDYSDKLQHSVAMKLHFNHC